MRRFFAIALMLACSSERSGYTDPNANAPPVTLDWPSTDVPLAAGALRIEGDLVAFFDTQKRAGVPARFKVFDGAADVTSQATLVVREARYARINGAEVTPTLGASDPIGVVTLIGARVGDKVGFKHLVLVQQARSGDRRDETALVPHNADAQPGAVTVKVGGGLSRIDVALVMDTTGSMGGSIKDLVDSLQTKIVPELQKSIPDVAFGLVEHKDYPIPPYGGSMDFVVKLHKTMTTDATEVRAELSKLTASGGGDLPEAQIPAMYHALTGSELKYEGGSVLKAAPPAGRIGAIGFRPGSLPVVILINDIDWHEPTVQPYDTSKVFDVVTLPQLADAFKTTNARFVSITEEGTVDGHVREAQPEALSDLTSSNVPPAAFNKACGEGKCCTGIGGAAREPTAPGGRCRLNFLHKSGEGVSSSLINAIAGLSIGSAFDVSAQASKAAELPDASNLVKKVSVLPMGDAAAGCGAMATKDRDGDGAPDAYEQVPVKTPVCFRVDLERNVAVPAGTKPTLLAARIDVSGDPGKILLDRRTIVFVVPPAP